VTDAIQGPALKLHQQLYKRSDGMVGHRMLGVPGHVCRYASIVRVRHAPSPRKTTSQATSTMKATPPDIVTVAP
jgi:hypothetical protein